MGDSFNSGGGNMNIAQDQASAVQTIQTDYTINEKVSIDEMLTLLGKVQQELSGLPLSESVKEELQNEVKGAQLQAKKNPPDKEKIADKLKTATSVLGEIPKTVTAAVAVGNLLRQGIEWCAKLSY